MKPGGIFDGGVFFIYSVGKEKSHRPSVLAIQPCEIGWQRHTNPDQAVCRSLLIPTKWNMMLNY